MVTLPSSRSRDKVALVTGSARRVGACIARLLHQEGMRVVVHYRGSADEAGRLCAELNRLRPDSARALGADLDQTAALGAFVERSADAFGRLDAIVNNASTFFATPLGTVDEAQWDRLMGPNLRAPFFIAQAAAAHLERTSGSIVNITDIFAERPLAHHAVYSVAKAGLAMLTRSLALELAPHVRVNAVAPGAVLWPEGEVEGPSHRALLERTPLRRRGDPLEVARATLFLIRDAAYTTGHTLTVDGGRVICSP